MNPQLTPLLNKITSSKTVFNPAIRVNTKGKELPTWIDDMSKVNGKFIFTVSTLHDNRKMMLDKLSEPQLAALTVRLKTIK